jgi:hypothetical protein
MIEYSAEETERRIANAWTLGARYGWSLSGVSSEKPVKVINAFSGELVEISHGSG